MGRRIEKTTVDVIVEDEEKLNYLELVAFLDTIIPGLNRIRASKYRDFKLCNTLCLSKEERQAIMNAERALENVRRRLIDSSVDYESLYKNVAEGNFIENDGNPDRLRQLFESAGLNYERLVELLR